MAIKSEGHSSTITKQGFHFAICDLCAKDTWHYKMADHTAAVCTNHSNYDSKKKHAVRINDHTMVIAHLTPEHAEAPSERELQIANQLNRSLWRNAEERNTGVCVSDEEWAKDLFPNAPQPRDPNKLYCSFCGDAVDQIAVITEKKPTITRTVDAYKDASGTVVMQEKVVTRMETVNACPRCCLKVRRPIVVRRV